MSISVGRLSVLIFTLGLTGNATARAESLSDRHVVFDNSIADSSYYRSEGFAIAPSQLELVEGKFPVETNHFTSPPNCLRLKWKSAPGGDWRIQLKTISRYGHELEFDGDTLGFWCYSEGDLSPEESPRISVQDVLGISTADLPLLNGCGRIPGGKWVKIRIPFEQLKPLFEGTDEVNFNSRKLSIIRLTQGLDDGKPHTIYLDDVQTEPLRDVAGPPPDPPTGLSAGAGELHIDLRWDAPRGAEPLKYQIYRSSDGTRYVPIGIQQGHRHRFVDFIGETRRKALYKISAIDLLGKESALSAQASATTRALADGELLDMVQEGCFRYYWEAGHPNAGMALEIVPGDENLVAVGASGFGIMALITGAERHFITREACAERLLKITRFLRKADRFHGAWPHFLNGETGRCVPFFGKYDDGGDLVETAFLVQGLLVARQYFDRENEAEREIRGTITDLWREVEWDWYRKDPAGDFLYWHWSPDYAWHISHPLVGWNETMMVYLLAIASPTHPVPASLYHSGWAGQSDRAVRYRRQWSRTTVGDHYTNGFSFGGLHLEVGEGNGGDLFFTQFSFLGFDPRGKRDRYADYYRNSRNIALINQAYCAENPRKYVGYSADCWGLSAGINSGGGRPQPRDDNGTICCSAALGSFPYTPGESMAALKYFYRKLGTRVWGIYGFHDGFNETDNWFEEVWMGLNQAVITVMIENYRTGLIWKKFMANPEIKPALTAIGFSACQD